MKHLFISPSYADKSCGKNLIEAAKRRNFSINKMFNSLNIAPDLLTEPVIVYGELPFCEYIAQEFSLNLLQNSPDWIARLQHTYVKRQIKYMTLGDAKVKQQIDHSILNKKIMESADGYLFHKGIHTTFPSNVALETPVLISNDTSYNAQHRFIICNNRIIDGGCYKMGAAYDQATIWNAKNAFDKVTAEDFVETVIRNNNIAPACILDVGIISKYGWAVIKTEPMYTAEMYRCDPERFLDALIVSCKSFV